MPTLTDGMTAAQYLTKIEEPGYGFGSGATRTAFKQKTIGEVDFLNTIFTDNFNGERESVYATDDGFVVEPAQGTYGDPTRWCVKDHWGRGRTDGDRLTGGLRYVRNLTEAAEVIAKIRRSQEG